MTEHHQQQKTADRLIMETMLDVPRESEVVQNLPSWHPSAFSLDQSAFVPANDREETGRLVHYLTRRPFSLSRLGKERNAGRIV